MTTGNAETTKSIGAQNLFTDWLQMRALETNLMDLSISGLADSTVTVQRTYDAGVTIKDIAQYTVADVINGDVEKVIEGSFNRNARYRAGIQTGDYGSDTVVITLAR